MKFLSLSKASVTPKLLRLEYFPKIYFHCVNTSYPMDNCFTGWRDRSRCRDKGLGDDPCVQKKECAICRGFTPEQTLQLSTPTYRDRKDKKATAFSSTPTLVDPAHVSVLGKVEKVKAVQSTPTPAKKTKRSESPKPSANKKKSSSSRPSAEDLKQLDDKWAERFSCLEAML